MSRDVPVISMEARGSPSHDGFKRRAAVMSHSDPVINVRGEGFRGHDRLKG